MRTETLPNGDVIKTYADGSKLYYRNGHRHREDGPAVEWANGSKFYYRFGKHMTEAEFNEWRASQSLTVKFKVGDRVKFDERGPYLTHRVAEINGEFVWLGHLNGSNKKIWVHQDDLTLVCPHTTKVCQECGEVAE